MCQVATSCNKLSQGKLLHYLTVTYVLFIFQLCATRKGRQFLKAKNTYIIMREYYAWERKHVPANETAALNHVICIVYIPVVSN